MNTVELRVNAKRILIVDDERVVSLTLAEILKHRGYHTQAADSAEDALTRISEWKPEAALLDVCLPKMNGVELGHTIKTHCPDCHILLFSGRPESEELANDVGNAREKFEILAKPVHPDFLLNWLQGCFQS